MLCFKISNSIRYHLKYVCVSSFICCVEDKVNTSNMDQSGSPMLSPLRANEEGIDGAGSQLQGINDDVEDDDPFLKRRYALL